MSKILIVDYGMGNIGSLINMFRRVGAEAEVAGDAASVARARKLLLPGVGAFDAAMERMAALGLDDALRKRAAEGVPVLGICLGMQLLTNSSEEGNRSGLGLIPAKTKRFPRDPSLKVPHMGWNVVRSVRPSGLTDWMRDEEETRFYFVHSYAVHVEQSRDCLLTARYGIEFAAAINRGNVYGAQFHPEKSHRFGMSLLSAFAALPC